MTSPFALSFSRLSTFEQCPAKFEHLYVTKRVQDADNEYTIYGSRVHAALEAYAKAGGGVERQSIAALENDDEASAWYPIVDMLLAKPGEKFFEVQVAMTRDKTICDWFSPEVWLRGILDVLIVDGSTAYVLDWKTGKIKDNPTQLQLFAAMVFAKFPEVQTVVTAFAWLAHGDVTPATYHRSKLAHIWNALEPRFKQVQDAVDIGVFVSKPSGLCRYCPARAICGDAR